MKRFFAQPHDIHDAYGNLRFGANPLKHIGNVSGMPTMRVRCAVPQSDGSCVVYGHAGGHDESWRIMRCRTFDGLHYEHAEIVFEQEAGPWLGETEIAHNTQDGSFLCLKWARGETGHALWAFGSKDGTQWHPLADAPVYVDHDAFGLMWDDRTARYIVYQTTYQKWGKRYPDNIGDHRRRVLHIRTSPDGVHWEPSENVPGSGPYLPDDRLITPDEDDPPEMEFYRLQVFPCGNRYAGMMLNYAPIPQVVNPRFPWNKHGPQLSGEWWISKDRETWSRPFRDTFAPGEAPGIVTHEPMTIGGNHLWIIENRVYGLPENRIFFVGSMANAEFSTALFTMAGKPLVLNASLCYHACKTRGMQGQSYIMVEKVDEQGNAVQGFEKERCILQAMDGPTAMLKWGDTDGTSLAGEQIRLRFYLRDARIYAMMTG